ncbi:MAG TPA: LysR family transcriptional regulator [Candidatus Saccharimonadales bacterium]
MEDRLHKLAALADAGSFTAAAAELRISQPALSAAIRKLERELKTPLIAHGARPVALTPAGQLAYATAKELAVSAESLKQQLAELVSAEIRLHIGMIDSVAGSIFADRGILDGFERRVQVSVMVNNSRTLCEAVERGELDLAFIADAPLTRSPKLQVNHVGDEPLVLVCARSQKAAYQAAAGRGTLPRFISYDQHSTTCRLVLESLHRHELQPQIDVFSTSPEVMLRLVQMEQGAAALPVAMVAPLIAQGELALVGQNRLGVINRGIAVVRRRDKVLPVQLQRLSRQVRHKLTQLQTEAGALPTAATASASATPGEAAAKTAA